MTDAAALLAALERQGLLPPDHRDAVVVAILDDHRRPSPPLYLKLVIGLGALVASLCFAGFLAAAGLVAFDSVPTLIGWGIVFAGLGLALRQGRRATSAVRRSFALQSSFCAMILGKLLFVAGVAQAMDGHEGWGIAVGAALATAGLWVLYPLSLDRFLSALGTLVALQLNLAFDGGPQAALLLDLFVGALLVAGGLLLTHPRVGRAGLTLGQAVAAALAWTILFLADQGRLIAVAAHPVLPITTANLLLTAALMATILWAAGSRERIVREAPLMALLGSIVLGAVSAPGVLLAVTLAVLGHARHDNGLRFGGLLLLPPFLILYYYNIEIDLLTKSGLLAGSGAVLLAGWSYVRLRLLPGIRA